MDKIQQGADWFLGGLDANPWVQDVRDQLSSGYPLRPVEMAAQGAVRHIFPPQPTGLPVRKQQTFTPDDVAASLGFKSADEARKASNLTEDEFNQYFVTDYQKNHDLGLQTKESLNRFTPETQYFLNSLPAENLTTTQLPFPTPHHHGAGSDRQNIEYNALRNVENTSGLDVPGFYRDLEATYKQNPWISDHAFHYEQAADPYMKMSPEERAKELYAHLGATFGPYILDTPLGKHYQGVYAKPTQTFPDYKAQQETKLGKDTFKAQVGQHQSYDNPNLYFDSGWGPGDQHALNMSYPIDSAPEDVPFIPNNPLSGHDHSAKDFSSLYQHYQDLIASGQMTNPDLAWSTALGTHNFPSDLRRSEVEKALQGQRAASQIRESNAANPFTGLGQWEDNLINKIPLLGGQNG